jgi:beta,beta-carotene 9',10'-dioxygenase
MPETTASAAPPTAAPARAPAPMSAGMERKGFESLEKETRIDSLPLRGELPKWLMGSLLRTGPAKWEVDGRGMNHWFDGLAMLHRFSFAGGEVSYANRFLQTRAYRAAREKGRIEYSEFATDPCRSLFQRVTSIFSPKLTDNANVNLTKLGERFIAMTETPIPVEFNGETLATAGVPYKPPGHLSTAHPHVDRATGGMLNYAAKLGPRSSYRFFLLRPESSKPDLIGSIPVREPSYMHSFGLTERWLVLAEYPYVVNPLRLATSGRPYIENYRWEPQRGTRFRLVERSTGETLGPFETEPRFGFHHVNSYEEGGDAVVDICTFPDAGIVEDLYLERLRAGKPVTAPTLERFRISPAPETVTVERLVEEPLELPRINYGSHNERPYRYVYGVGSDGTGWLDRIVKADVVDRTTARWSEAECYPGEAVFVKAPDASQEDEGVLLSVVLDGRRETSFLLALDAHDLTELARAEVPHHIPFGFHGQFARN